MSFNWEINAGHILTTASLVGLWIGTYVAYRVKYEREKAEDRLKSAEDKRETDKLLAVERVRLDAQQAAVEQNVRNLHVDIHEIKDTLKESSIQIRNDFREIKNAIADVTAAGHSMVESAENRIHLLELEMARREGGTELANKIADRFVQVNTSIINGQAHRSQ